jgi:hypothetical protein
MYLLSLLIGLNLININYIQISLSSQLFLISISRKKKFLSLDAFVFFLFGIVDLVFLYNFKSLGLKNFMNVIWYPFDFYSRNNPRWG